MAKINADTLNLEERVVRTNKVQKTHKGGRTMSWSVLVVVGDRNGYVGAGLGKARAIPDAIRKGIEDAKKNLIEVPTVGTTVPHEILARHGAAEVLLKPASPGTGIVAGSSVRTILELAGVQNVLGKSLGSSNPVNIAWATIRALQSLKRGEDVARLRGRPLREMAPWMCKAEEPAGVSADAQA
ncbi:MAG: 30S ribosomal protein S5 [Armatimonadetes bacterium]|jgi:small subunit ribosomal protein S5|nr:30S ribosomal protein S5 [Armatimonadota bacterium]